jgi:hypothetical protein
MKPEVLSSELRSGSSRILHLHRKALSLSPHVAGALAPISRYQLGGIRRCPEPRAIMERAISERIHARR